MTPYLCYSELSHQREAWQQAVDNVLSVRHTLRSFFETHQPDQIIFLACGSPYYLGHSAAIYWQRQFRLPTRAVMASEMFLYPDTYLPPDGQRPLLVVISRSGSTSEVLWALDGYESRFAGRALLVTCTPGSPLSQRIPQQIVLPAASEQTVPQTRSFAAMYLTVQLIASILGNDQPLIDILTDAPGYADTVLVKWEDQIAELVADDHIHNLFYLGSGPLYGIAQEASLKMAEMSLTEAFAYPFLESRHGPRALIDEHTMVVGLFGQAGSRYENPVMAELRQDSQARTVALAPAHLGEIPGAVSTFSFEPSWPDVIQGLAYLPFVQLMAYHRAVAKGVNPDESRNLVPYVSLDKAEDSIP